MMLVLTELSFSFDSRTLLPNTSLSPEQVQWLKLSISIQVNGRTLAKSKPGRSLKFLAVFYETQSVTKTFTNLPLLILHKVPASTPLQNAEERSSSAGSVCALTRPLLVAFDYWTEVPTVAETKSNFLKAYKRPIPSIYNTVLQELLVQQHLLRYKKFYQYDLAFALGFVTAYNQLMEGYPSDEDREAIFKAYIQALNEDPEQYRVDALKLEEWARSQNLDSLTEFSARGEEVEEILEGVAERAGGSFCNVMFAAQPLLYL